MTTKTIRCNRCKGPLQADLDCDTTRYAYNCEACSEAANDDARTDEEPTMITIPICPGCNHKASACACRQFNHLAAVHAAQQIVSTHKETTAMTPTFSPEIVAYFRAPGNAPAPRGTVFASMRTIPTKPGRPTYQLHTRLEDGSIARIKCAVCQKPLKTLSASRIYCTSRCAAVMAPARVDTDTTTWFN